MSQSELAATTQNVAEFIIHLRSLTELALSCCYSPQLIEAIARHGSSLKALKMNCRCSETFISDYQLPRHPMELRDLVYIQKNCSGLNHINFTFVLSPDPEDETVSSPYL
jgi:hypothetical protein